MAILKFKTGGSRPAGRHTFVRQFLEDKAAGRPAPSDWCYVYNFDDPRQPKALRLPPGVGKNLRVDVEHAIQDAQAVIPAAFESEDFQTQQEAIAEDFKARRENDFNDIEKAAHERGIGVISTPTGIAFIPMRGNEVIKSEDFEKLPKKQQKRMVQNTEGSVQLKSKVKGQG